MSNIGKIIRVNALPPLKERENNVIYQVAAPGAATYTDYAIDSNGDLKTPSYIPLTGTEEGKPLTKNIEVDHNEEGSVGFISNTPDISEAVIAIQEGNSILAESRNNTDNNSSSISVHHDTGIEISATTPNDQFSAIVDVSGLQGNEYIQPTSDQHYVQRKYVADNFTSQTALNSTLANYYTKPETYSKTEVDAKFSAVYRPKGSVDNFTSLPTTGNVEGDVYNLLDTGANYVWVTNLNNTGTAGWDKLSETVDLTNYVTLNTDQDIESRKQFIRNGGGENWDNNPITLLGLGGKFAGVTFYSSGFDIGQLTFNGNFNFLNQDSTGYKNLVAQGYYKAGSSNDYLLRGAGDHVLMSDFALATDLSEYVTVSTPQDIEARKSFGGATGNNFNSGAIETRGNGSTIYPSIGFHQPGLYGSSLQYRGDGFYFMNINGAEFDDVRAAGYIKDTSSDAYVLTGGGGHKAISDFAQTSQLGNYVTINTAQTIEADKTLANAAKLTILGTETYGANNTQSFNLAEPNGNIVSGWLNTFYGNFWKYGIVRGGDSSSSGVKFGFDFSSDDNTTYSRVLSIDANSGALELKNGGKIDEYGNTTIKQITSGSNATGTWWLNKNGSGDNVASIGTLFNSGDYQYSYIGWGASPWEASTCLAVAPDAFLYKGNQVWHAGNFNPATKTNAMQNATGVGFSSGNFPTVDGTEYPYFYYDNGTTSGLVPIATQGWINYRFNKLSGDFVTINGVAQNILGDKSFASSSSVTFEGVDLNTVHVWRNTTGDIGIVSGHEYQHYDTRWKVGNRRGSSTNSLGYSFEFSNDNGATYTEKARIDATGIFTGNAFSSPVLTGNQIFNANQTNVLVIGNDEVPDIYYNSLNNHVFISNGATKAVVTNTGLSVHGDISVNGSSVITESQRGTANGFAPLGTDSKISSAYLPSYVDDVLEFANLAAFPVTGESGKIYVDLDTNLTYRWGGSSYTQIAAGAVQSVNGHVGIVTLGKSDVGLANADNTSDAAKNVLSATKWTTPRTLSYTGDVTGSASVDGSGNVGFAMTLANSGVSAGTYNSVNVDAKGRVLSGTNINYATESYVADLLQQNYLDQSVSDERFVNAEGDETINGNKTFSSSPSIPAATSGDHAVNLEQLTANLAHVVNDNDDFKLLEVYRLIDSTPIDLDDTRVKKYNIVFDGSSNGSVNINHLRDNQYYQFSNIAGTGADLRIGVEGYGMVDIVSPGKTAVYMSWGDGKLLKISENANVSII
ncbi:hypothetical protein JI747_007130 [Chryseobacterium sp. RG1]|uniref:Uncharacterized protein n=1 Tax=Chryseobacterium tagetis TaxID=2801334 RepID=A0ABS7ZYX5_9FLAO|nr:hypothetical protein [Chryseobacterium tagetis]MCA6066944.1 hypothetical protein [Chryseobacterium tagetis]